ncbi:UBX domain-containing protein [Actinidia rufa]|uniref:UBX domain-containing protein n=1 Tax=Actinidia rufa TaxID=165716 RepID=A0A7J0DMF4_9ERIC|nr:UBX domain-containing protein [Actinidia rufa]
MIILVVSIPIPCSVSEALQNPQSVAAMQEEMDALERNGITAVKQALEKSFDIKDIGSLRYFLGIEIARSLRGICLSQRKYTLNLLQDTNADYAGSRVIDALLLGYVHSMAATFYRGKATSWKLEEAIQLFFVGNENGLGATSGSALSLDDRSSDRTLGGSKRDIVDDNVRQDDSNEVRAPIPVKREVLYDSAIHYGSRMGYPSHEAHSAVPFRNFNEEMKRPGIWESDQGATSMADNARDNLASLYRPPFTLMHTGPFEKAKDSAKFQDKWFLVNVQSTAEFSSHMLNRDTWANEAVAQTITSNFIFWQINDDTEEGRKVCTYYRLDSIPVVLVIDPITGQKMRSWCGMIQPESLLEDLLPFMDGSPKDHVTLSNKRPRESSSPNKIQAKPSRTSFGSSLFTSIDLLSNLKTTSQQWFVAIPNIRPHTQNPELDDQSTVESQVQTTKVQLRFTNGQLRFTSIDFRFTLRVARALAILCFL